MAQVASPTLIKRYDGRRLNDTQAGCYVTLGTIADLVREEREVMVQDAKTGGDITQAMLSKIVAGV